MLPCLAELRISARKTQCIHACRSHIAQQNKVWDCKFACDPCAWQNVCTDGIVAAARRCHTYRVRGGLLRSCEHPAAAVAPTQNHRLVRPCRGALHRGRCNRAATVLHWASRMVLVRVRQLGCHSTVPWSLCGYTSVIIVPLCNSVTV